MLEQCVSAQYNDEKKALLGIGPYHLGPGFRSLVLSSNLLAAIAPELKIK